MTVGSHVAAASLVQTEGEKQATSIAKKATRKCGREMENLDQKVCDVTLQRDSGLPSCSESRTSCG